MKPQTLQVLLIIALLSLLPYTGVNASSSSNIIDHNCINLSDIPLEWIDKAKADLNIGYGHTSHGSQITTGMNALESFFTDGTYDWSHGGGTNQLHLFEGSGYAGGYLDHDVGYNGWDLKTRRYLDDHPDCNVIIWSWCGQVNDVNLMDHYFIPMSTLRHEYPHVTFVYMTGHLEGQGTGGTLQAANDQIREHCRDSNLYLFDFADISKYSPDCDTNFQEYRCTDNCDYNHPLGGTANWATDWLARNPDHELTKITQGCGSCAHSQRLNCVKKGVAAWYLWARLAGWSEGPSSAKQITSFSFAEQTGPAVIDNVSHNIDIEVKAGTDLTKLVPTITISNLSTITPASGIARDFSKTVSYTVTAEDTSTLDWTVKVTSKSLSSENDIIAFSVANQIGTEAIDATNHRVSLVVGSSSDITNLIPTIEISSNATVSPASGVAQDFSSPVTYTVTAEDGTKQAWEISITQLSGANDIISFSVPGKIGLCDIDLVNHTLSLDVASGTDLTNLKPTIAISSNAKIDPASGVARNFSSPVTYNVTAEDGTVQEWTVSINVLSGENDITSFSIADQVGSTTIDAVNHTVSLAVGSSADITNLVPTIEVSANATVSPASGVAQDFSAPVTYTVKSEDGTEQEWTVTVQQLAGENDITSFTIADQIGSTSIDAVNHTVSLAVGSSSDITNLIPTIEVSLNATISPASGVAQDFSSPVTYTVTSEDGTE
ncbi:MAG: DUF5018 domain-containing protein, partial [Bacteroidales bacterium]|nr:DUF5018 domain-containing protein [Bacteroidales bacterium]